MAQLYIIEGDFTFCRDIRHRKKFTSSLKEKREQDKNTSTSKTASNNTRLRPSHRRLATISPTPPTTTAPKLKHISPPRNTTRSISKRSNSEDIDKYKNQARNLNNLRLQKLHSSKNLNFSTATTSTSSTNAPVFRHQNRCDFNQTSVNLSTHLDHHHNSTCNNTLNHTHNTQTVHTLDNHTHAQTHTQVNLTTLPQTVSNNSNLYNFSVNNSVPQTVRILPQNQTNHNSIPPLVPKKAPIFEQTQTSQLQLQNQHPGRINQNHLVISQQNKNMQFSNNPREPVTRTLRNSTSTVINQKVNLNKSPVLKVKRITSPLIQIQNSNQTHNPSTHHHNTITNHNTATTSHNNFSYQSSQSHLTTATTQSQTTEMIDKTDTASQSSNNSRNSTKSENNLSLAKFLPSYLNGNSRYKFLCRTKSDPSLTSNDDK